MCRDRLHRTGLERMACRARSAALVLVRRRLALHGRLTAWVKRLRRIVPMRWRGWERLSILVVHGSVGLLLMMAAVSLVP